MKKNEMRILALLLTLALAIACLAGCSSGKAETAETTAAGSAATTAAGSAATTAAGERKCKVGVVNTGTAETMAWTRAHKEGIDYLKEKMPDLDVVWVEDVADSGPDCGTVIDELVNEGCNLIFTTSYGFMQATQEAAKKYPNVLFFHNQSTTYGDNLGVYDVRDYEAVFLTGYLAERVSKGNFLGYVGTNPMPTVIRAANAFALGAKYANSDVKMQAVFTNSWYDVTAEKEAALALIDSGAKALGMQVSSPAVVQASQERGIYSVGFSDDMHDYAPKSVLCSFKWNWGPLYLYMVQSFIDGTLTKGEDLFFGLDKGCGGITAYNKDLVSDDIAKDCDALFEKLKSGDVKVFYGAIKDNTGKTHGTADKDLPSEDIRSMDWLVDFMSGKV